MTKCKKRSMMLLKIESFRGEQFCGAAEAQLDAIAWQLNTRPRKSMGFRCPAELLTPDAFDFKQHHAALFALGH